MLFLLQIHELPVVVNNFPSASLQTVVFVVLLIRFHFMNKSFEDIEGVSVFLDELVSEFELPVDHEEFLPNLLHLSILVPEVIHVREVPVGELDSFFKECILRVVIEFLIAVSGCLREHLYSFLYFFVLNLALVVIQQLLVINPFFSINYGLLPGSPCVLRNALNIDQTVAIWISVGSPIFLNVELFLGTLGSLLENLI